MCVEDMNDELISQHLVYSPKYQTSFQSAEEVLDMKHSDRDTAIPFYVNRRVRKNYSQSYTYVSQAYATRNSLEGPTRGSRSVNCTDRQCGYTENDVQQEKYKTVGPKEEVGIIMQEDRLSPRRHEFPPPPPLTHAPLLFDAGRGREERRVDTNCSFSVLHSTKTSPEN